MGGIWRAHRFALIAAGLALIAAIPAVLTTFHVSNPWALTGAMAVAAVVVVFGALLQERYRRLTGRRDEQTFHVEDGCLVLADGRLPAVRDISDPVVLGVHEAAPPDGHLPGRPAPGQVPAYIPRDVDAELRERLAAGGFVLLAGDSTAGKSRAAFEAMAATVPGHLLVCPANRDAVAAAVTRAAQAQRCVLWLDDLERYLGTGGLTATQLGRLLSGQGHHRVVIATIRAAEQARITAESAADDAARQVGREARQILGQAHSIRIDRMFSAAELDRARARDWDPRVAEALDHAHTYGIAEYIAAGPELLREWEDARSSSEGPHARGAALVAAAIDIRRAGYTAAIRRTLLDDVHEHYLNDPEHVRIPRESADDAWAWATPQRRATTALLRPTALDRVEVFDYLVDAIQRRSGWTEHVPEPVVRAAIDAAEPADADSLAVMAYRQGRYGLAAHGWQHAYAAKATTSGVGADHPDSLISRGNLATVLADLGRLDEAEAEHRAVLEIRARVLGPEHPDTLNSRNNLAIVLARLGRLEDAEAEFRALLHIRTRVLGPEHPSTLTSRNNLALVLARLGRLEDAETEHRAVLHICARVQGPQHPDTLGSRNNLALVLARLGRLDEAEAEHRNVLHIRTRVLGPQHPSTLTSRSNLANVLARLGRLDEAEAEHRNVLHIRTRVLGPQHPDTLNSRNNVANVLADLGRLAEAETEHRAVLYIRTRVLGPQHPDTLTSRNNLATVVADQAAECATDRRHIRGEGTMKPMATRNCPQPPGTEGA